MDGKSTFGAEPERIDRLLSIGLEGSSSGEDPDPTASLDFFTEKPGGQIGRYKLLSVLGEGGMGIVYLAEQKQPIRRQVALKVIKPGMDSARVIARFEAERQALALLDHPNIAHVYDAGATEAGRPYFVMEYVKGLSITEHCDRHKLTIEDRLNLFRQVCFAVHHAHQKGIIHRDIKPSNILVSLQDDQAVPKIIDFGVAKALAQPLTERTLVTEQGQLFGTPEYMSPEQADMANEDIDTRSDIYSLGVLLYVLLTGVLPFDSTTFREGGIEHIRQVIRETDPKTPSTRLSSLGEEAKRVAESRRIEVATLAKKLHKELEWIPLKAMRKERSERYRSASELADDIDNYLKGAPLLAGPPSTVYRLKKFVRRNHVLVGGIAALLAVLVAGILVSTIFAIGQARALAENQIITDFLRTGVLGTVADAKVGEATVSYVLDAASKNLEGKFYDRPLIEAEIRETLGGTYRMLAESTKAEQHWLRALQIYRQHYGEEHPSTLKAKNGLYWVYDDQERHYDAERLRTEMLQIGPDIDEEPHAGNMGALAHTYHHLGKYKEAESLYNKILEIVRRERGEDYIYFYPMVTCNLARVYADQGRYDEAEGLFRKTLETVEWDAESRWRLVYTADLANMYRDQGRYGEAELLLVKTLAIERRVLGDGHKLTLQTMYVLVRVYTAQKRYEDAKGLLNEGLKLARHLLREGHPATLRFVYALAVLRAKQENEIEAEALFKEALQGRQRELGPDHPETLESKNDFGLLYKEQARYEEAEPLLLEAVEGRRLKLGGKHPHTLESMRNLVELYEAWGKPEKAEEWREVDN
ncbi:MAG TPA: serine/threonine-protein kinase [Sedimentisphaerales bacterium]|nr:serine/threonine-protein kinase [Sedimentisphaerales bacterium]